jgi:hypothetical protein
MEINKNSQTTSTNCQNQAKIFEGAGGSAIDLFIIVNERLVIRKVAIYLINTYVIYIK